MKSPLRRWFLIVVCVAVASLLPGTALGQRFRTTPIIFTNLPDLTVAAGGEVSYTITASSQPQAPTVTWYVNDVATTSGVRVSGATTTSVDSTLTLSGLTANTRVYARAVTDTVAPAQSNIATITVVAPSVSAPTTPVPTAPAAPIAEAPGVWVERAPIPTGDVVADLAYSDRLSTLISVGYTGTIFYSGDLGGTWGRATVPAGVTGRINGVLTAPDGLLSPSFIAVGARGTILTTDGGVTWQAQASGTTNEFTGIVAGRDGGGATRLVAVGKAGAIVYSADGKTWTAATAPAADDYSAVAYGGGVFVTVGLGGSIATSPDGRTWTKRVLGATTNLYGAAYGAGTFVVVGDDGLAYTSTDGVTWTRRTTGLIAGSHVTSVGVVTGDHLTHVVFQNGAFFAVGFNGSIVSSTNGATWTKQQSGTTFVLLGATGGRTYNFACGNGGLVIRTVTVAGTGSTPVTPTEAPGVWLARAPIPTGDVMGDLIFSERVSTLISVGYSGTIFYSGDAAASWTRATVPASATGRINSVLAAPDGVTTTGFVAVGEAGLILTSDTGNSWQAQTSGTTTELAHIATGRDSTGATVLVVAGNGGVILSSTDARTWTRATSPTTDNLNAIAFGDGVFVIAGLGGAVVTSTDGRTWTKRSVGATTNLYGAAYGAGVFVVAGDDGLVYTSPNGVTWTRRVTGLIAGDHLTSAGVVSGDHLTRAIFRNNAFVAAGFNGSIVTSPDGIAWTKQTSGTTFVLLGLTSGGGYFYAGGNGGRVIRALAQAGPSAAARISNLSIRGPAGTGDNSLIVGFALAGSQAKSLLIRVAGPALRDFGITDALADPSLTLVAGSTVRAQNDNWGTGGAGAAAIAAAAVSVSAFPYKDTSSRDAALLTNLAGAGFSAVVSGAGNTTGTVLVEVYDAETSTTNTSRLNNLSARAQVGTGDNVLIAGFYVGGPAGTTRTLLIRAVGPTLTDYGVSGVLADPVLKVYQGNTLLAANDDWTNQSSSTQVRTAANGVGAFALSSSLDSVVLITVGPGLYSAQVAGFGGGTGVALVEIYDVP